MSEEKKESKEEETTKDSTSEKPSEKDTAKAAEEVKAKADAAAKAAEKAEAAAKRAIAKATKAKAEAEAAAEAEYKVIAEEVKAESAKAPEYTRKRQGEEIFRREMGEPEFFLDKQDRFPRPILSAEEEETITRKAEIFQNQIPEYRPEHVLSPEYGGMSSYERGVGEFLDKVRSKLAALQNNPDTTEKEIQEVKNKIAYLESLHENYFIGMNVFRTAKGGRNKIKA